MSEDQPVYNEDIDAEDAKLPIPVGYKVLICVPTPPETFESGIIKADKTRHDEAILTMVGVVIDLGPQAYKDPVRFSEGPWCQRGDYVIFRAHSGTRFKVEGVEYRLLNDDSIEAVVKDPTGLTRI